MPLYNDLEKLFDDLKKYRASLIVLKKPKSDWDFGFPLLAINPQEESEKLRESIIKTIGKLNQNIGNLTGKIILPQMIPYASATANFSGLDVTGDIVLEAIGKLTQEGSNTPVLSTKPTNCSIFPIEIFDSMHLHSLISTTSRALFRDGHYSSAILEAFKVVNIFVKEKARSPKDANGKSLDGCKLMAKVFNKDNPILQLNPLKEDYELDEQDGFMYLFMGATVGIRNPKAHAIVQQKDPYKTLEYLGFASLLIKTIDSWET